MLSKEPTIDLLILTNRMTEDYAKQGALKDFYETSLLDEWPKEWIDMRSQVETGGKLYGIPKRHTQSFFGWNDELAERLEIEKPNQPWTWDQYQALCQNLSYDLTGNGRNDFYLMRGDDHRAVPSPFINDFLMQYGYQYALPGGSFQTKEFEILMGLFMDIYSSGALLGIDERAPILANEEALLMTRFAPDTALTNIDGKHSFLLPPTIDTGNPGYVGVLYMYSLPQNAPHEELALEFLRGTLDPDLQKVVMTMNQSFTKTMPEYYVYNYDLYYYGAFTPDQAGAMTYVVDTVDNYEICLVADIDGEMSHEIFEYYTFMREHILLNSGHWYDLAIHWFDLLPQYMNNTLPLAELTRSLDRRMDMMQRE